MGWAILHNVAFSGPLFVLWMHTPKYMSVIAPLVTFKSFIFSVHGQEHMLKFAVLLYI